MEVILLERIEKLGNMGELVVVKAGFARNYLIPNNKCLRATAQNKKYFEDKKEELAKASLDKKTRAESLVGKIENFRLDILKTAGESGHLYGSVKITDISSTLQQHGFDINKSQVVLNETIRTIGVFSVKIQLHPELSVNIFANISRTKDEGDIQFKKHFEAKKEDKQENVEQA
jgi:large subunit ribosomal protein L9